MPQESIDVRYVAQLARLDLSEDEITRFSSQLSGVMTHIEKLSEVDIDDIQPSSLTDSQPPLLRADEPIPGLGPDALLANAPDQANGQLRVPKVVDA